MGIVYLRGLCALTLLIVSLHPLAVAAQCDPNEECSRCLVSVAGNCITRGNDPVCEVRKAACRSEIVESSVSPIQPFAPLVGRAREVGDTALETAFRNGEELVSNFGETTEKAVKDVLNSADKAVQDTANTYLKAANDTVDAVEAISRFAEREIQGIGTSLSANEERFREGKVVDAILHLGTDRLSNTEENALKLAQENEWARLAMQSAASAYGGPAGAAAFAAWYAYRLTGDFESAVRAGTTAYILAYGNAKLNGMPTETASEILRKGAMAGVVGGIAVAASGGTTEESLNAFVKSGGAVLVQSGQAYVNENHVDPAKAAAMTSLERAKAQADAFCMSAVEASCVEAAQWVKDIRADVEAVKNVAQSQPTVVASPDGQWAISWNGQSAPTTAVPNVVLTYIGEGSAYRDHLQQITSMTSDSVAESGWVAFESSDEVQKFFEYVDGRQVGALPEVGDVFAADANVRIRHLPNSDTVNMVLDKNSVVTVLEVQSVEVDGTAQEWIRILTEPTNANAVSRWINRGETHLSCNVVETCQESFSRSKECKQWVGELSFALLGNADGSFLMGWSREGDLVYPHVASEVDQGWIKIYNSSGNEEQSGFSMQLVLEASGGATLSVAEFRENSLSGSMYWLTCASPDIPDIDDSSDIDLD